ncbi:MAG: hypothetical protein GX963_06475 [Bacteroidales bacterium]|nr:hypothetical protein [Bacteroidales bacterium]
MGLDQKFLIVDKEWDLEIEINMRKLNIIQGYFEKEYDIENLETINIDIKDIQFLQDNSVKTLENKDIEVAKELLPIQGGFFYGNYEYNDWYWKDVKKVYDVTKEMLDIFDKNIHFIQYRCWW